MRLFLVGILAIAALAPLAVAAGSCVPSCEVLANTYAFASPVTILSSGSTLTWTFLDPLIPVHTATSAEACFDEAINAARDGAATLTIASGALFASTAKGTRACTSATALPGGSFTLNYVCLYHKQMVGQLVVNPGG